jgi:hypothetical protein
VYGDGTVTAGAGVGMRVRPVLGRNIGIPEALKV